MNPQQAAAELAEIFREFSRTRGELWARAARDMGACLKKGGKVLVFGNGGSAAQAQHFAAELVNRFLVLRPAIPALALTTDSSVLTSISNDSSFSAVFSRQLEALGRKGDVALALSTSGKSANVVEAVKVATKKGMLTVALTGEGGGRLKPLADFLLDVPSRSIPRIQEAHLVLLHVLAEGLEKAV